MGYIFVLQLALKPLVYQYVTDIQGEFWSLVGPEGLPQANNANALNWRTGKNPPVEAKRLSSGLVNQLNPPDMAGLYVSLSRTADILGVPVAVIDCLRNDPAHGFPRKYNFDAAAKDDRAKRARDEVA